MKPLTTKCLLVDANVENKDFYYLKHVADYSTVLSLTPTSDTPPSEYFEYQFATSGYTMFPNRFEKGWTAEFVFSFNDAVTLTGTPENVLFYMGKTKNLSGHTTDFVDNNFTIIVDDDKSLIFKYVKYINECNCDTLEEKIRTTVKKSLPLTTSTGTTKHHLVIVFEKEIGVYGDDLHYYGGNIDCSDFPNTRWFDGAKFRMGRIKIYFDGLLKEIIDGVEETIFRVTENDLEKVQGWGISDEKIYSLSTLYDIAGYFTGDLVRGRFYECPLTPDLIKINFEYFAYEYTITDPLSTC